MDPATVVALIGLGGSGVAALWKIANGLGRFESRTTTTRSILFGQSSLLELATTSASLQNSYSTRLI